MLPKITIITPTFNQGRFIEKSILSVINQNYPNLEYIIIDGGSTDETLSIIEKYKNNITYYVTEKDRGQSHAINKGIEKATGEVINWLNSDDFLEENALFKIAGYFKNENVNVVAGYSTYVNEDGVTIENVKFRTFINENDLFATIANTSVNQPSTFFRKKIFDKIIPVNEELHYNMDLYLWLKYLCLDGTKHVVLCNDYLSTVSIHAEAKTIKHFKKTFPEKENIYNCLFSSLLNTKTSLNYDIKSIPRDDKSFTSLKKYYYRYRLFNRNLLGKRVSFSFFNFFNYLYYSIKARFI